MIDFVAKHFNIFVFFLAILRFEYSSELLIIQFIGLSVALLLIAKCKVKLSKVDYLFFMLNSIMVILVIGIVVYETTLPSALY